MIFWLAAALLTAAVTGIILWPLIRVPKAEDKAGAHDVEVYRDQLSELDRDIEAGNLTPADAELARAEIARRLIKADEEGRRRPSGRSAVRSWRGAAAAAVVVLVPVVGLGCYSALGSPGLPSEPLSAREAGPGGDPELARLIGKAERHLRADPDDGRGWDVLAPIYFRTGRLEDARVAYGNAIRLLGPTARRESGLGEVLVMTSGGQVTDAARAAFQNALKLEPNDPKAAFYLALGLAQDGKREEAIAAFNGLARRAPPNAPWLPAVQAQIAALGGAAAKPGGAAETATNAGAAAAPPGNPTPEQMAAAENMSASDRLAMIRGMVGQLDSRLSAEPDNFPGWMRLVRSYMVLNEPAKAKDALGRALKAFPADTDHGKKLMALAAKLGIPTAERAP